MIRHRVRCITAALAPALLTGLAACSSHPSPTPTAAKTDPYSAQLASLQAMSDGAAPSAHVMTLSQETSTSAARPRDAAAPVHEYFKVDAYQFTVPIGTLGRNEEFWKRIDEQCVDVATYDLLFKNGLRVGVAPMSEFDTIKKYLGPESSAQKIIINGAVAKKVQLETRKDLIGQTIFYFDNKNQPVGRTFDRCTNLIDLSFEPTPRVTGSVRVSFAPEVRAARARLEFTLLNEEREFQYVAPETFYDLNCRADIPREEFLVLAPSSDADRETSVGHAFLTTDASPQRMEQVIVLIPHVVIAEDRPTVAAETNAKAAH